ncbi:MAG: recombinase family protein [Armatimonadetes bacterium]|nr:recombinase family protein [Armatimonadota bacterium]
MVGAVGANRTTAVILARVSTQHQQDDGVSLDLQEVECRFLAKKKGLTVVGVVRETISGRKDVNKRPGLSEAIDLVQQHDAILVAYAISRVARSTRVFLNLIDPDGGLGIPVLSVTEPYFETLHGSMGKMLVGLISIFAEWEANLIRERTRAAMAELKRQGRRLGAPRAYESRDDSGEIVLDPRKVKLLRYVRDLAEWNPKASQRGGCPAGC